MRVLIVGAGISGCIAALASSEAGHQVTVLETSEFPGGVLRDHELEHGRWYRNCQYMNVGAPWCDLLLSTTGLDHYVFPHRYGSWNDLFGQVVVHHDFAQVVIPELTAVPLGGGCSFASAADRIDRYPERVATVLHHWGARWGDLQILDHNNCNTMQLGRVFLRDDLIGVLACKKEQPESDILYGVPRSLMQPSAPLQSAALPIGGWNRAFDTIVRELHRRGVRLHLQSPARARLQSGRIRVESRHEVFASDLIVWCANPNPLVHALGLEQLDSPSTRMVNVLLEVEGTLPEQPTYWQIFSCTSPVVRLFAYRLDDRQCMTVEAFDTGVDDAQLTEDSLRFARDLGLNIGLKVAGRVPERRYVLLTARDRDRFTRLDDVAMAAGVITGGWHAYGRDQRLAHILGAMKRRGAI